MNDDTIRTPGPYQERFPWKTRVRIADRETLERYMRPQWKFHHPVQPEQLEYAGMTTTVRSVGFYHGGDVLYNLTDISSYTWHEACLREAGESAT